MTLAAIQLELTRPDALFGLLLLGALGFYFAHSLVDFSLHQRIVSLIVRSVIVVLIVLALAGLTLLQPTTRQHVVFAIDRSLSVGDAARPRVDQLLAAAERARGDSRMSTIDFASDDERTTNIAEAITAAAASMDPYRVPHIVLVTDGNETQGDALRAAAGAQMRISTIALPPRDEPEVQVSSVNAPSQVREGEPFYLDVTIDANRAGEGVVEVFRGPHRVARQTLQLAEHENTLRLRQSIDSGRMVEFAVRVSGFEDTLLDNNTAGAMVYAQGRPRVLLIESQPRSRPAEHRHGRTPPAGHAHVADGPARVRTVDSFQRRGDGFVA